MLCCASICLLHQLSAVVKMALKWCESAVNLVLKTVAGKLPFHWPSLDRMEGRCSCRPGCPGSEEELESSAYAGSKSLFLGHTTLI